MDNGGDFNSGSLPTDHPEQFSRNQIRQGTTGHNVRYVLAISLISAIVLMMAAYWWLREAARRVRSAHGPPFIPVPAGGRHAPRSPRVGLEHAQNIL